MQGFGGLLRTFEPPAAPPLSPTNFLETRAVVTLRGWAHALVLSVCFGDICRSPLAKAAFSRAAEEAALDVYVDSALPSR